MLKTSFIFLIYIYIYRESAVFLNFFFLPLLFINVQQALYGHPGCLKCISSINLSPANKNLLTISFILYLVLTCNNKGILLKDVFIPRLLKINL